MEIKMKDVFNFPHGVIRDKYLSGLAVRVYCALACVDQTEQDNTGEVNISRKRLKSLSRTCDRTLKTAINELVDSGWIDIVSGKESGVNNTYTIHYKKEVR